MLCFCLCLRSSFSNNDYSDYADDTDDAHNSFSSWNVRKCEPAPSDSNESLQKATAQVEQRQVKAEVQVAQSHHHDAASRLINHLERGQPEVSGPATVSQKECARGEIALHTMKDASRDTGTGCEMKSKNHCPRHPHAQKVSFDPSGQAWCEKLDCWDCYRLMKIREALSYPRLLSQTGPADTIEQGIEAWSAFVTSRSPFAVMYATDKAIAFCRTIGIEVPDLSGEAKRLVDVNERGDSQHGD
jgi:hypothetical protein